MILCYHKVHPTAKTIWWLPVDTFYRQMAALRSRTVVPLDGYDPTDPDHVVITFDGVYDNVHAYALPVLEHFGYPFELFVIGDYIGRENTFDQTVEPPCMFADKDMLLDMEKRGGRVQWHTRTHKRFSTMTPTQSAEELTIPESLGGAFGSASLRWFAYPHGEIGDNHREVIRQSFTGALACDDGDPSDRFNLPRTLVFKDHSFFKGTVSAIVPNYNYGRFLREAIDSLERQTVKPDEILIIDDASTDDSAAVLDQLESRGYRVERNKQNLGIVENFRKAIALTSGDYIFFLGADNRLRSDFVLETRLGLDRDPSVAISYTDLLIFGPLSGELALSVGAERVGRSVVENWDIFHWKQPAPTEAALRDFKTRNFVHGSSMYRRSAYEGVGGYIRTESPEDHHLFYRIWAAGGGLAHVAMPVLEYRQHSPAQANTIIGLQTEIKALRNELTWTRTESQTYAKSLEAQIARVESELARAAPYQAGLEADVAAYRHELAKAAPYQASLEAQIAAHEVELSKAAAHIENLEHQIAGGRAEPEGRASPPREDESTAPLQAAHATAADYWSANYFSDAFNRTEWQVHPHAAERRRRLLGGKPREQWFRDTYLPGRTVKAAIGIGVGRAETEIGLLALGAVEHYHLWDISPVGLEHARSVATEKGFGHRVTTHRGDFFSSDTPLGEYDLVTFVASLHHFPDPQATLRKARACLVPGGLLWASTEYIGPDRFQYPPEHRRIAELFHAQLPANLRKHGLPSIIFPTAGEVEASDPTESPASSRLVEAMRAVFPDSDVVSLYGALPFILFWGLEHQELYDSAEGRELVRYVIAMDTALTEAGVLPPYFANLVGRNTVTGPSA